MKPSSKVIIAVTILVAILVIFTAYTLLNGALTPLEQREDKTTISPTQSVEIQAITFNGDIVIENSTNNEIEIIYNVKAPQGHITEITTTTTNQTQNDSTKIVTEAKITQSGLKVNYIAIIVIKLPINSQYNLTLSTLNGNIIKPQLNDTTISASTNNGSIDIKEDNATSIDASSQNGSIKISLTEGTLFQIDASSSNGQVTYQGIAMNTSIQTTHHLKGNTTNGLGNLNLKLSTANGNITIEYLSNHS